MLFGGPNPVALNPCPAMETPFTTTSNNHWKRDMRMPPSLKCKRGAFLGRLFLGHNDDDDDDDDISHTALLESLFE